MIAVNKLDRADRAKAAAALQGAAELELAEEIFPVSARTGSGVSVLVEHLVDAAATGAVLLLGGAALRPA